MGSQVQRTPVVEGTLNPRWNHSMQFMVKDVRDDVLCISVFDRDYFSPNGGCWWWWGGKLRPDFSVS